MFDEFGAHIIVYRAQDVWMHTNALKKSRYTRMHTHTHRQIHPHYTIDYTTYHLTELGANQFTDTSIVLFSFSIFSGVLFSLSIYSPVVLVFFTEVNCAINESLFSSLLCIPQICLPSLPQWKRTNENAQKSNRTGI